MENDSNASATEKPSFSDEPSDDEVIPSKIKDMNLTPIREDPPKGPSNNGRPLKKEESVAHLPQKTQPSTSSTPNSSGNAGEEKEKKKSEKKVKKKQDLTTLRKGQALYDAINKRGDTIVENATAFYNITHNPIQVIIPNRTTLTKPRGFKSENFDGFEPKVVKRKKKRTIQDTEPDVGDSQDQSTMAYDMSDTSEALHTPKKKEGPCEPNLQEVHHRVENRRG